MGLGVAPPWWKRPSALGASLPNMSLTSARAREGWSAHSTLLSFPDQRKIALCLVAQTWACVLASKAQIAGATGALRREVRWPSDAGSTVATARGSAGRWSHPLALLKHAR